MKLKSMSVQAKLGSGRDIHIECSKQFRWNLHFYVSGQSGPFWAVLKLQYEIEIGYHTYNSMYWAGCKLEKWKKKPLI